jgi:hypothetical protein
VAFQGHNLETIARLDRQGFDKPDSERSSPRADSNGQGGSHFSHGGLVLHAHHTSCFDFKTSIFCVLISECNVTSSQSHKKAAFDIRIVRMVKVQKQKDISLL